MVLQSSGQISIKDIATEFGISSNSQISVNSLYGKSAGVPVSGTFNLSNLWSKRDLKVTLTTKAADLGGNGIAPWNVTHADSGVRFLWNNANGTGGTEPGWVLFQSTYFNSNNSSASVNFNFAADNDGFVYVNKSLINGAGGYGGWFAPAQSTDTVFLSGSNLIEIAARNLPEPPPNSNNPACILYYVKSASNNIILRSDNNSASPLVNTSFTYCSTPTSPNQPTIS